MFTVRRLRCPLTIGLWTYVSEPTLTPSSIPGLTITRSISYLSGSGRPRERTNLCSPRVSTVKAVWIRFESESGMLSYPTRRFNIGLQKAECVRHPDYPDPSGTLLLENPIAKGPHP